MAIPLLSVSSSLQVVKASFAPSDLKVTLLEAGASWIPLSYTGFKEAFAPLWNSISNSGELLSIDTLLSYSRKRSNSSFPPGCSDGSFGLFLPSTAILDAFIAKTSTTGNLMNQR